MRIKSLLLFASAGLVLIIIGAESYSQVRGLKSTKVSIYKRMEKSSQHYYLDPASALGDSITVDDYIDIYFPRMSTHVTYPKVTIADSTIVLSSFEFDSSAINEVLLGKVRFEKGDFVMARKIFENAIGISDNCYVAYLYIGDCHLVSGDAVKALKYYKKAYDINPFDYKTSFSIGTAYRVLERYDEALEKFIEALTLMPRNKEILKELSKLDELMDIRLVDNSFRPQALVIRKDDGVHIYVDGLTMEVWFPYAGVKALWLGENYKEDSLLRESNRGYKWSMEGEREALASLVGNYLLLKENNEVEPDEYLDRLAGIVQDGYIDGFIIYEMWSRVYPDIVLLMTQSLRDEVREYISRYIVVR